MLPASQRWSLIRICAICNPSDYKLPWKKRVIHFQAPQLHILYYGIWGKALQSDGHHPFYIFCEVCFMFKVPLFTGNTLRGSLPPHMLSKPCITRVHHLSSRHWLCRVGFVRENLKSVSLSICRCRSTLKAESALYKTLNNKTTGKQLFHKIQSSCITELWRN